MKDQDIEKVTKLEEGGEKESRKEVCDRKDWQRYREGEQCK